MRKARGPRTGTCCWTTGPSSSARPSSPTLAGEGAARSLISGGQKSQVSFLVGFHKKRRTEGSGLDEVFFPLPGPSIFSKWPPMAGSLRCPRILGPPARCPFSPLSWLRGVPLLKKRPQKKSWYPYSRVGRFGARGFGFGFAALVLVGGLLGKNLPLGHQQTIQPVSRGKLRSQAIHPREDFRKRPHHLSQFGILLILRLGEGNGWGFH